MMGEAESGTEDGPVKTSSKTNETTVNGICDEEELPMDVDSEDNHTVHDSTEISNEPITTAGQHTTETHESRKSDISMKSGDSQNNIVNELNENEDNDNDENRDDVDKEVNDGGGGVDDDDNNNNNENEDGDVSGSVGGIGDDDDEMSVEDMHINNENLNKDDDDDDDDNDNDDDDDDDDDISKQNIRNSDDGTDPTEKDTTLIVNGDDLQYNITNIDEKSNNDNDVQIVNDTPEVHAISDSEDNDADDDDDDVIDGDDVNDVEDDDDDVIPSLDKNGNLKRIQQQQSNDGNRENGHIQQIDDKPVSIHSDSDIEEQHPDTVNSKSSNYNNTNEIHEILSDKEDCVVVEDDLKENVSSSGSTGGIAVAGGGGGGGGGSSSTTNEISPRRSTRARKSIVKVRDFSAFDDDIEEIIEDPLQQQSLPAKRQKEMPPVMQLTINDARSLASGESIQSVVGNNSHQFQQQFLHQQSTKKDPTLVIIDTNSLLSRSGGNNVGLSQQHVNNIQKTQQNYTVSSSNQGIYPTNIRASITPISKQSNYKPMNLMNSSSLSTLLPALTDDMFVLEAPSFIVPYIYEKPPTNQLKEIVTKMGELIEENRKQEEELAEQQQQQEEHQQQQQQQEQQKSITDDTTEKSNVKPDEEQPEQENTENINESKENKIITTGEKSSSRKKKRKTGDDSWDESDTSTDDEASDTEQRTKVLIKEIKEDLDTIKTHILSDPIKITNNISNTNSINSTGHDHRKSDSYFDSPLGKFFIDIGINLVQEHVQTDLLRQQKRKLNKDGNKPSPSTQMALNSLMKNLELSKIKNSIYKFGTKRCEFCNFKSESGLTMAHHYETPHIHQQIYKCNFCSFETRPPYDILFHMEAVHNIKGRLEKTPSYHQCPNCLFEDNGKSKLSRHALVCAKKFRPDTNLNPPMDWEPPAKIPRIKPRHGLVGTATAYQALASQAQRLVSEAALQRQNPINAVNAALLRGRGRPQQPLTKPLPVVGSIVRNNQTSVRPQIPGMVLPNNFQLAPSGQFIQTPGPKSSKNISQQPSISITPLPRQPNLQSSVPSSLQMANSVARAVNMSGVSNVKPGGQNSQGGGGGGGSGKASFVICEICDGYIKDLDQLRNHMQWMHKVKIHPKMIYNRPPLNCQKCQFRFFTDQGLERHLLGSHGLVTSSMQEAANKGKDAGRCPVCGKMYQWKLLNHVSRDHNMTLKPAHLSYKCTVCTATFGMYKQFENHVYSAHSTVARKSSVDNKKNSPVAGGSKTININSSNSSSNLSGSSGGGGGESLLKPLKINDEITIIPQPTSRSLNKNNMDIESHIID